MTLPKYFTLVFRIRCTCTLRAVKQYITQNRLIVMGCGESKLDLIGKIISDVDSNKSLTLLSNTIVPSIQNFLLNGVACTFKYVKNCFVGSSLIMSQQTTDVLKKKHLRLELFKEFCVMIEQRSTGIFKTEPFSCIREALTRCTTRKQIKIALFQTEVILQIKAGDIGNIIIDNSPLRSVPTERI